MKKTVSIKQFFIFILAFVFVTFFSNGTFTDEIIVKYIEDFFDERDSGDSYNYNTPDHDRDGVPNGRDPDFSRGKTGGRRWRNNFIDKNGDGYNDNAPDHDKDGIPDHIDKDFKKFRCETGWGHKTNVVSGEKESGVNSDPCLKKCSF